MKTFACHAPYGSGGLGRHLAELVEDARVDGSLAAYYTPLPKDGDDAGRAVRDPIAPLLLRWTPVRFSPGMSTAAVFSLFDRAVARAITPTETHVGFSLQSERTFLAARAGGCSELLLVSPTCHIDYVRERYEEAYRRRPIERSWLNAALRRRAHREYELADAIVVASDYVQRSFLEAGFPAERLRRFDLSPGARFVPGASPHDGRFRVVYVGALSVAKGTPLLVEAFARLKAGDAELWLVGGYGTRGMRRWLGARCAEDARIRVALGDPLPHLQRADLYVHPSYQDGSPYAPLEAMACGVPVVVSEDTGTKELVHEGVNGYVIPTGSVEAVFEALSEAYERRTARVAS